MSDYFFSNETNSDARPMSNRTTHLWTARPDRGRVCEFCNLADPPAGGAWCPSGFVVAAVAVVILTVAAEQAIRPK